MTDITRLAEELQQLVAWQRTPEPLTIDDYCDMVQYGIKTLYIDTGRALQYSASMFTEDDYGNVVFAEDLPIDEERYVLLVAQIHFFKRVQTDVNNITSYTTDALSITGADKPYAHLKDSIAELENERRIVYYSMVRYTIGV